MAKHSTDHPLAVNPANFVSVALPIAGPLEALGLVVGLEECELSRHGTEPYSSANLAEICVLLGWDPSTLARVCCDCGVQIIENCCVCVI